MKDDKALIRYLLRLGDNALILAQRLIEVVASGPELEEELANANFSLDYLGQARMFYTLAGELEGRGRGEDDFAFHRQDREFENLLLVEQPNGHFGDIIVRGVLFDTFYLSQLEALAECEHQGLADIATKASKEIRYHLRHGKQWLIRLGDGTDESHRRVQASLDGLWKFTGEMFAGDATDAGVHTELAGPDLKQIESAWHKNISAVVESATLNMPEEQWMASGGREGIHSEAFGFLIAHMQHVPRTHPGLQW